MHAFQLELLEQAKNGGSCIIVAPTGCGKTRVAQELIGWTLRQKQDARTIFLTDKVALAIQQAGVQSHCLPLFGTQLADNTPAVQGSHITPQCCHKAYSCPVCFDNQAL